LPGVIKRTVSHDLDLYEYDERGFSDLDLEKLKVVWLVDLGLCHAVHDV
jgi:hypothetical protein